MKSIAYIYATERFKSTFKEFVADNNHSKFEWRRIYYLNSISDRFIEFDTCFLNDILKKYIKFLKSIRIVEFEKIFVSFIRASLEKGLKSYLSHESNCKIAFMSFSKSSIALLEI